MLIEINIFLKILDLYKICKTNFFKIIIQYIYNIKIIFIFSISFSYLLLLLSLKINYKYIIFFFAFYKIISCKCIIKFFKNVCIFVLIT